MKSMWRVGLGAMVFLVSFVYKAEAQTNEVWEYVIVQEYEEGYTDIHDYKHQFGKKKHNKSEIFVNSVNICAVEDNYKQQAGKSGKVRPENVVIIEEGDFAVVDRNYKHQAI